MSDQIQGEAVEKLKNGENGVQPAEGHLSSIEQKDLTPIQRVLSSTAFWILVILVILVAIFGYLTPQ